MGRLAAALLAAAVSTVGVSAEARMHSPYRGHRIIPANAAPLDGFTALGGAYSFRKLLTAYAGPAVKLQRVDTTTQDIGFTAAGDFDTAAATAFCTTACTGFTWYDQSGLGRHLTPLTTGPAYVANCIGAKPCFRMTTAGTNGFTSAATVTPATGLVSISVVANRVSGTANCVFFRQTNGATQARIFPQNTVANVWQLNATSGPITTPAVDGAVHAALGIVNGASSSLNIDGTTVTGNVVVTTAAGSPGMSGAASTTCDVMEPIVWDNYAVTPAEAATLIANQRNYWMPAPLDSFTQPSGAYSFRKLRSAYAGPAIRIRRASDNLETDINFLGCTGFTGCPWDSAAAASHCASTTCFGRTWYDQSGNVRDLAQATTANQFELVFNCNGALPCWRATVNTQVFAGPSVTPATVVVGFAGVGNRTLGTGTCTWIRENGLANRLISQGVANAWQLVGGSSGTIAAPATDGAWHAAVGAITGAATSYIDVDGATVTGTATGTTTGAAMAILGAASTTCLFGESVFWDNYTLTAPEAAALIANQRSFGWIP